MPSRSDNYLQLGSTTLRRLRIPDDSRGYVSDLLLERGQCGHDSPALAISFASQLRLVPVLNVFREGKKYALLNMARTGVNGRIRNSQKALRVNPRDFESVHFFGHRLRQNFRDRPA